MPNKCEWITICARIKQKNNFQTEVTKCGYKWSSNEVTKSYKVANPS